MDEQKEYKLVEEWLFGRFQWYGIRHTAYPAFKHLVETGIVTTDAAKLVAFTKHLNSIKPRGVQQNLQFLWEVFNQTKTN